MGWLPQIPVRLLPDEMTVRVALGAGRFDDAVTVGHVRFVRAQSERDDDHRDADAGSGRVYIDAVNSPGAFEVPVGSRVWIRGRSYTVWRSRVCEGNIGEAHHYEVDVR